MQQRSDVIAYSGLSESPLRHAEQVVPGVILTGAYANYAWLVERTATEHDGRVRVIVQKVGARAIPACAHAWLYGDDSRICACGHAEQLLSALLPAEGGDPRVTVLVPQGGARYDVQPRTVYLAETGLTVSQVDSAWVVQGDAVSLPLLPWLYPLWTLPEGL